MKYVRSLIRLALVATIPIVWTAAGAHEKGPAHELESAGRESTQQGDAGVPRLVLLLTIDQFRFDYLTRFDAEFTSGLRRLVTDGAVFLNANLDHYPTVTAAGHATFTTGALLSSSGIVGNDWFDREAGASVSSVSDDSVRLLGGSGGKGASPHRLLVSTLADEIKLAARASRANSMPRAIGISLKDRGAILGVGRMADAAYWYENGHFVSSTYYFEALPDWVRRFNEGKHTEVYAGKSWPFWDASAGPARVLPPASGAELHEAVYASPFGNDLLVRFAEHVLESERLGQRGATDVLSISFSSNDAIGHNYGPDSAEVRAVTIATDRALGLLLATVDRLVGLEHTLVALTSDHGVAPLPEVLAANRLPGGRLAQAAVFGPIQTALESAFGSGQWIVATAGTSPYLNYTLMKERKVDPATARRLAANAVAAVPHVARVYTRDQLLERNVPSDILSRRVLNGFHPQRSGDLEILLDPYWIRRTTGTTHGTPYTYDAHVPLIFMGRGIRPGRYPQSVTLNDAAPTLATRVGVAIPGAAVGRVLSEALEGPANPTRTVQ